jgi:hypothetical protein
MSQDDDDNIIRFPTFVRIEGEEPPAFEPFRCYVLVNRQTARCRSTTGPPHPLRGTRRSS